MSLTLRKIGLALFTRKAKAVKVKLTHGKTTITLEKICTHKEIVYLWNWEKGFRTLSVEEHLKFQDTLILGLILTHFLQRIIDKEDKSFIPVMVAVYDKETRKFQYVFFDNLFPDKKDDFHEIAKLLWDKIEKMAAMKGLEDIMTHNEP